MDNIAADLPDFIRVIIALSLVIGLMGALAFVLKKMGLATDTLVKTGDKQRLKIIESLPLDARRRLIIVQCDDKEHLIVLGNNTETIVDKNISPTSSVD